MWKVIPQGFQREGQFYFRTVALIAQSFIHLLYISIRNYQQKLKCDLGREKKLYLLFLYLLTHAGWSTCPIPLSSNIAFPMLCINESISFHLPGSNNYHKLYHLILLCILKRWRNRETEQNCFKLCILLDFAPFREVGNPGPPHLAMNAPLYPSLSLSFPAGYR